MMKQIIFAVFLVFATNGLAKADEKTFILAMPPWISPIDGKYCVLGVCLGMSLDQLPEQETWYATSGIRFYDLAPAYERFRVLRDRRLTCPFGAQYGDAFKDPTYDTLDSEGEFGRIKITVTAIPKATASDHSNYGVVGIEFAGKISESEFIILPETLSKLWPKLKPSYNYISNYPNVSLSVFQNTKVAVMLMPNIPIERAARLSSYSEEMKYNFSWNETFLRNLEEQRTRLRKQVGCIAPNDNRPNAVKALGE